METVDFNIVRADTVPINYTWDTGVPFDSLINTEPAYSTTTYTSGYAPGLKVKFKNLSFIGINVRNITYNWDFGDYYNDTANFISLTGNDDVEHIYVMPGKYTVTLNAAETLPSLDLTIGNDKKCLGRHKVRWFWDDLKKTTLNNITWDETKCRKLASTPSERYKPKTWGDEYECLGKYCKAWSWLGNTPSVAQLGAVKWKETQTEAEFQKKWQFEPNDIECEADQAIEPFSKSTIKTSIIEVFEMPPTAGMHSLTQPVTGESPFTVVLSPKLCKTGSFPIDRIDWDFGDGSPIVSITRYTTPQDNIFKRAVPVPYPDDLADVRNYTATHTYEFTKNTYPLFYPSLTCYSANTNTYDSCSIVIGPLSVPYAPKTIKVIKNRNTTNGNIYALEVDDNLLFVTTSQEKKSTNNKIIFNTPSNPLKNTLRLPNTTYTGNSGNNYLNAPNISLL